jgi:hypothetical protein
VRDSLLAAAAALDRRASGAAEVGPIAEAIDPTRPIGEQQDAVVRVLSGSADRIRAFRS